ncbi:hypothetical protein CYCD_10420 [Tenuifilaceae bacterium CYCD]|nr:hypothetical protein CYCD_10420 [Tenuifilaceae bacterium CYCD]
MASSNNYSQDELDNHANQLNPNNDAYWQSRGYEERSDDWDDDSIDGGISDDYDGPYFDD